MTTKIKSTNTDFGSETDGIIIPKGTTGERASTTSGSIRFNTTTNSLEYYDGSDYVILENAPTLTSVSPTQIRENDSSLTTTFIVTGTNFKAGITAHLRSHTGSIINFDTVTRDSTTQLTCVITNSNVIVQTEPFDVVITSASGKTAELLDQISINNAVYFTTASGSLYSSRSAEVSATVQAIDPESGVVTYDLYSGNLPPSVTLNTSTGVISGTSSVAVSDTTYSFSIRATDAGSNTTIRDFSITLLGPQITSFTSSGTFSVPSGITSVDVLVIAGGGGGGYAPPGCGTGAFYSGAGGAGGLIYRPGFPVTPGGTVTVTVGCGGTAGSSNGTPAPSGQDSVFGTLTAKGGGGGGGRTSNGTPGGSGGGGGAPGTRPGGSATQPTQPGDSGTYGFGNAGGTGTCSPSPVATQGTGGGGGGAGSAGGNGGTGKPGPYSTGAPHYAWGGPGGAGRAYTIADGTTPVYYAGGGSGGGHSGASGPELAAGAVAKGNPGVANRGGGAGAGETTGGKGIVIVKF
jgi:hypothetical protein